MEKINQPLESFLNALAKRGVAVAVAVGLVPALLILYLGYSFFIQPGMAAIGEQQTQLNLVEADVAKGKAVEASEADFKNEFRRTIELYYETLPLLPKESEISNVLFGVQTVAARNQVMLTGLTAIKDGSNSPNAKMLIEREIPAQVVGNYNDVMRFFYDLSRQSRILIVRDYNVESAVSKQKDSRPVFVAANFSLLAFHAPPKADFPTNIPPDMMPAAPVLTNNPVYTENPTQIAAQQGEK
ncbi:MAG: type 4a pilus biogenesis protein PilO [Pyrinomonadaceae bacterium]|nr:type 4a pilus biogenesis protein PilO [Pyrinomonadaceae bacterium]